MLTTKDAPGTDASAERQPQDPERPDDDQQREPEGTPTDDGKGAGKPGADAPQEPDRAADGKTQAPEADTTDWKAKHDDAEAKRRDIQSKYDKLVNDSKQGDQKLSTLDAAWRGWVERNAPDAWAKLVAHEQTQGKAREDGRNARSRSDSVILGVYREGDKAFGDYLTDLADSGASISPQSLERHRETFKKYAGNGSASGAPAANTTTTTPPSPPRSPGAGRPAVEAPPAWDGKTFSPRAYLTEGLAKGDARNRPQNPKRSLVASR